MLNERQAIILEHVIRDYIETARPVGSQMIVASHSLNISAATVRNDFAVLEEEGFIEQPHTSSGRIPTAHGYQYYIKRLTGSTNKNQGYEREVKQAMRHNERGVTDLLAEFSGGGVVWVDRNGRTYYSGMGTLFSQPEFDDETVRMSIAGLFDRFEEVVGRLQINAREDIQWSVGDEAMLDTAECSVLSTSVQSGKKFPMIVVIGPMRMNYEKTFGLLKALKEFYE